jgi:hypothetical protein
MYAIGRYNGECVFCEVQIGDKEIMGNPLRNQSRKHDISLYKREEQEIKYHHI